MATKSRRKKSKRKGVNFGPQAQMIIEVDVAAGDALENGITHEYRALRNQAPLDRAFRGRFSADDVKAIVEAFELAAVRSMGMMGYRLLEQGQKSIEADELLEHIGGHMDDIEPFKLPPKSKRGKI